MSPSGARALPLLKPALLALYFASLVPGTISRFADIEGAPAQIVFACLLALAVVGIVGMAWTRSGWLRWTGAVIFAAGSWFMEGYARSALDFMTYAVFIDLINATGFAGDAVEQNGRALLFALPRALVLLLAIGLKPRLRPFGPAWVWRLLPLAPLLAVGAFTGLAFLRGGDGLKGLPGSYPAISYSLLAGYERATGDLGPREEVGIPRSGDPLYRDIVLLIDESVTAHYLDINAPEGVASGLTDLPEPAEAINYGVAAAITNCSTGSNLALRYGGTRENYRRDIAVGPSLWAYARGAGMETVYLDAQRTGGAMQNGMGDAELAEIDRFIQFDEVPIVERDIRLAERLEELLADDRSSFIIANKVGAHFPVHDKYPPDRAIYRPSLQQGRYTDIVDTGSRAGFGGSEEDWRRYRNSYRNTLAWNTGEFFERLFARAKLDNALIVYTSDHGQDLHEDLQRGTTTHCSSSPRPEEGAVPLVVLQSREGAMSFRPDGVASHYMIAPTLLAAMGYDRTAVEARYGGALDQPSRDPGTFNTLFNARLNREPQWLRVDPRDFVRVPDDEAR